MADVAHQRNGYTSFPRNHLGSHSHESNTNSPVKQHTSPWYSCQHSPNINPEEPETDHPPSPEMEHRKRFHGAEGGLQQQRPLSPGRLKFRLNPQGGQHMHQQQPPPTTNNQNRQPQQKQTQRRPNYPTTIQVPSYDDQHLPFDEGHGLDRLSLDDTFGFEKDSTLLEQLYTGNEEEEGEGTVQSSSVELNPYTCGALGQCKAAEHSVVDTDYNHTKKWHEKNQQQQHQQIVNQNKNKVMRTQAAINTMQQERDSIFRNSTQQKQTQQRARMITPTSAAGESPYEQRLNVNMQQQQQQLVSPTEAMDRRRSYKPTTTNPQARSEVASPTSSMFTTSNHSNSIHRNNTGTTSTSRSTRHRSTSRNHRSRSRGTSTTSRHRHSNSSRRSRSRSTSIAASKRGDEYHQSLFRGAALIREQLLRSMASADQAMDEAEQEFMQDIGLCGDRQQLLREARLARQKSKDADAADEDEDDFDLDYSVSRGGQGGEGRSAVDNEPSPSRGSCVRFAPSQDSSALETESKRLDTLMTAFVRPNSSVSSGNDGGVEYQRSSSDKENNVLECRPNNVVEHPAAVCQTIDTHDIISPTSTLGLSSPTSAQVHDQYASRYFQEDPPKPLVTGVPQQAVDSTPNTNNRSNARPVDDSRVRQQPGRVDGALAHAQRAGPLWRSLVGNHVRFPSKWESILPPTTFPIHRVDQKWSKWYYVARHRVKGDKRLNSREYGVRSRRSGGRILMRLVIREMHSQQATREVVIGAFHPNSKGIRHGDPKPESEDVREVWMAVRWLMDVHDDEPTPDLRSEGYEYEGVIDNYLLQKRKALDYSVMGSALGHRKAVNNENVRAVFGDQPPMSTTDLHEDELADILKANCSKKLAILPALLLLKLFLFSK